MAVDWDKPILLCDDRGCKPARFLGVRECPESWGRRVVLVETGDGEKIVTAKDDGAIDAIRRISNAPRRIVKWLNVYNEDAFVPHDTREKADASRRERRIACIRIEFEEGEGL